MVNHLTIQGRLVDAPAFGDTTGGTRYANFRLAWSEKYKEKETRCFLDCKAFGGTAQFMEKYMNQKGQEIVAEGKLNTEEWEKDGQKRSKISLMVSAMHFCGSRQGGAEQDGTTQSVPAPAPVYVSTEELPF